MWRLKNGFNMFLKENKMAIQSKDILKAIQELSGRTDHSFVPDSLRAKEQEPTSQNLPKTVAEHLGSKDERGIGISMLVSMSYKSLSGNVKNRDILIRRVVQSHGEFFINGLAMDIKAPRLIKVKDISEIRDVITGKVYTNPVEFIENRLGIPLVSDAQKAKSVQSDFQKVIERTGPAMTVLMYLSGIDGVRRPAERQKIMDHVRSRTQDLNYSDEELNEYLISLAPDLESFKMALQQVLSKDKDVIQKVVQSMLSVITIDNKIDDRERAFISRIISLLEQEGFEFNLPV